MQKVKEKLMRTVFLICACVSILAVVLICVYLFATGVPAMKEIGFTDFLFGQKWKPSNNLYGILPFILGSIYVTAGSIIIGVPTALLTAIFLAFYCPKKLYPILKAMVNLMAGIPSVVYGFFGLVMIVPLMRDMFTFIRDFDGEIPGACAKDCGNYLDMNLPMARYYAEKYLTEVLEHVVPERLNYPE